jgi:SNF2 family DNA or RNA helicase
MAPRAHQIEGVRKLLLNPAYAIFDEVGAGKTKQVIDVAFFLFKRNEIDAVIVVAPGSVRSVWCDPDPVLGEVAKHGWPAGSGVPFYLQEYHAKTKAILEKKAALLFVVSNYEFLRREERLLPLLDWAKRRRVLLVLDESWMVQSHTAQQTKAMFRLRQACRRVVLLNGTPGDPQSLYAQFSILDQKILGFKNFFAFRAHHAVMGGWQNKKIVGWRNMDEFRAKTENVAIRRLTRDVFDMGDEPVRTQIDVRLDAQEWKLYKQMRDDMVAWLDSSTASVAAQAGTKALRLAQILAGFVGGLEIDGDLLDVQPCLTGAATRESVREVGRSKLKAVLAYLQEQGTPDKAVIWCRFRPENQRVARELLTTFPTHTVGQLYGGQTAEERQTVKSLLAPGGDPRPAYVVGSAQAGGAGLHFGAASIAIYLTNSFSLKDRLQTEGRLDRPGQLGQVRFVDVLASGPDGQKTIDHHVASALRKKEELADWTAAVWRQKLTEE